jgi:hypothetical protein
MAHSIRAFIKAATQREDGAGECAAHDELDDGADLAKFIWYWGAGCLMPASSIIVTGPRGTGKSALVRGLALEGDLPVVWVTPARLASEFSSRMTVGLSRYCDMALRLQPSIRTLSIPSPLPSLAKGSSLRFAVVPSRSRNGRYGRAVSGGGGWA